MVNYDKPGKVDLSTLRIDHTNLSDPRRMLFTFLDAYLTNMSGTDGNIQKLRARANLMFRSPSRYGHDFDSVNDGLQEVELDYGEYTTEARGKRAYENRINSAVRNAGQNLVMALDVAQKGYGRRDDMEGAYLTKEGIFALAPYWGDQSQEYISQAKTIWRGTARRVLNSKVQDLSDIATQGFDRDVTPSKFHQAAADFSGFLGRYGIKQNVGDSILDPIARTMYSRASTELFPRTLEEISDSGVESSAQGAIKDIPAVLGYAWSGGVDITRIRQIAQEMLEANEENRIPHLMGGNVKIGTGQEMQKGGWGFQEVNDSAQDLGEQLESEGYQLIGAYEGIKSTIESTMEAIERWQVDVSSNSDGEDVATPSLVKRLLGDIGKRLSGLPNFA
tara:strand:+ start:1333 stop:2505 length:1173 start_codon:yes stop_codon:yes gene_type:complete